MIWSSSVYGLYGVFDGSRDTEYVIRFRNVPQDIHKIGKVMCMVRFCVTWLSRTSYNDVGNNNISWLFHGYGVWFMFMRCGIWLGGMQHDLE